MNDQLEQAILSVLSGSNVSAANDYILKFVETDQSWAAAMMICKTRGENDNLRYFAANILYTKVGLQTFCITISVKFVLADLHYLNRLIYSQVRRNWSQLAEDKREHLYLFLSEIIMSAGFPATSEDYTRKVF